MPRSSLLKTLSLFIGKALQVYSTEVDKLWNLIHTERFLETFHDFQNSRIEIMNIEDKMPFLSTIMNSLESGCKGNKYVFAERKSLEEQKYFFDGADYQAFFYGELSKFYIPGHLCCGLLNVGLWKIHPRSTIGL
ncbi:ADM_collapsed_G0040290.mRNA.1.CDS.1 [Saccharomyces cerevisiae]|nr:ADM_collapsed_G0040290.mRNA.1.CDS.1 [Saccharomyces cerevisiae]